MFDRFVRILGLSTTALVLIPSVAISGTDTPRNTCFLSADGIPLSDDYPIAPEAMTVLVVHGFRDSGVSAASLRQAGAVRLRFPEANVIVVAWRPASKSLEQGDATQKRRRWFDVEWSFGPWREYSDWAETTKAVGRDIAGWMKQRGISPHRTVISGHSLGAQIAAFASNECARAEMCGEPVHTIIAADPAGPNFELSSPKQRLDPTDAQRVIVVHTTELFGDEHPIGTSDIHIDWPKSKQPDPISRHSLAREFVTASFLETDTSTTDQMAPDANAFGSATVRIDGTDVVLTDNLPSSTLKKESVALSGNSDDVVAYVQHAANHEHRR